MLDNSNDLNRKLAVAVEKMPAFPKSVQRILELSRDINCSPKDLVAVIEKDPVMTMRLLRVLNSAYYSFPKQITSVNQSVVYLGLNTIKNMALSFAALGALPKNNAAGFDVQRYLLHSLTTASMARLVSQKFKVADADPTDCYLAGLLHDFGKVVFAQFMAQEFRQALQKSEDEQISLREAELAVIGSDHTVVGAMLVEKWQFPSGISTLIREHHVPPASAVGVAPCLFIANQVSKRLGFAAPGYLAVEALPPELVGHFGVDLDAVIATLGDITKLVEEAQMYAQASKETA
ncbi:MAG: HDOD domain-containing protein [Gallionellaceae bacterium]|nr:MAG: HDOD domain-containing protein [Gallionellaceae bacterium]